MQENKSLLVPGAIIIAGLLIASSVYFSNRNRPINPTGVQNLPAGTIATADIAINPITEKDYIRGNPNAKVVVLEFSDPECPFCKVFHNTMKSLTDKYAKDGGLAWVYRNFPLTSLHPNAPKESEALLCAGKVGGQNGFWAYTDRLYAVTPSNNKFDMAQLPVIAKDVGLDVTAFNKCLSSGEMAPIVKADYDDGVKAGGTGTPFNVFIVQKPFDKKAVENFFTTQILKVGYPANLFQISNDNLRVSVSGAMQEAFITELMAVLTK
jgi:protein-disulfide isomerase